jgi:hypothetical protein
MVYEEHWFGQYDLIGVIAEFDEIVEKMKWSVEKKREGKGREREVGF